MPRIAGINIPEGKKAKVGLVSIYGIGRQNVYAVLKKADVDGEKKIKDLTDQELSRLQRAIDTLPTEGGLRKLSTENIKRLKETGAYRGLRHAAGLPTRGQRTRSNARTKRGKRLTVGALKKELAQKLEKTKKEKGKE